LIIFLGFYKKIGVYFLYDDNKTIIYVGKSVSTIRGRLNNHLFASTPNRYDDNKNDKILKIRQTIKYFSYIEVPKDYIDMVERYFINIYKPLNNIEFKYK
jgi:excinuclease UvrABC nuclease subunit